MLNMSARHQIVKKLQGFEKKVVILPRSPLQSKNENCLDFNETWLSDAADSAISKTVFIFVMRPVVIEIFKINYPPNLPNFIIKKLNFS